MRRIHVIILLALLVAGATYYAMSGQSEEQVEPEVEAAPVGVVTPVTEDPPKETDTPEVPVIEEPEPVKQDEEEEQEPKSSEAADPDSIPVIAEPESITVMVNKTIRLPIDYKPSDLVYPDVAFIFDEKVEKRMMRKEAAEALESMFSAAEEDGIMLAGVSGYRSGSTQKALFERYVRRDGEETASRYSARPGHSEHQTGLAMDVSGTTGKCAATDCFADTDEAAWLDEHAREFGYIIRYPEGKEEITGYKYEPWHLRYVGIELSQEIASQGITLEEYEQNIATPASN
jgi:D-alanyl-D-alanine carboxypeptidase